MVYGVQWKFTTVDLIENLWQSCSKMHVAFTFFLWIQHEFQLSYIESSEICSKNLQQICKRMSMLRIRKSAPCTIFLMEKICRFVKSYWLAFYCNLLLTYTGKICSIYSKCEFSFIDIYINEEKSQHLSRSKNSEGDLLNHQQNTATEVLRFFFISLNCGSLTRNYIALHPLPWKCCFALSLSR